MTAASHLFPLYVLKSLPDDHHFLLPKDALDYIPVQIVRQFLLYVQGKCVHSKKSLENEYVRKDTDICM